MDAVNAVLAVPLSSSATASVPQTTTPAKSHVVNVNQSNTHSGWNSLNTTTNSNTISNSNINIGVTSSSSSSSNSNSSCCSSSTSSNSSGYGSTTTTPTNNYDLQQQTTPTTTPVPTTPVAIAEPIIPVANVAAVTPFYSESVQTHNLAAHHLHDRHQRHAQQHLQQQQHNVLPPNHPQLAQNHLQTDMQQQQQYLPRQQYYSAYDYQQPAPTHSLSDSSAVAGSPAYNVGVAGPYELSSSSYQVAGHCRSSNLTGVTHYERSTGIRTNPVNSYQQQHHQQQQQQQTEHPQPKAINQQTQPFSGVLTSSKQRSSSLIGNSSSTNTSKPQAAATPFYAQPLIQSNPNSSTFYDNLKQKTPLDYHDSYSNSLAGTVSSYHQHQKYYAAAKSQLKETNYGSPANLNSKTLYSNTGNFFNGSSVSHGMSSTTAYDKYMYPHTAAAGYTAATHLSNESPPDISSYRKTVVANTVNSPSWPWGIDYASGNSRTVPPPASHLPTATVAPTHATYLAPNPTTLARDPYYMGHDKYGLKFDKYTAPTYQQSYVSPPATRHHIWPNTPHASNLTQLNERHLLATGPPAPPSHGLHATPYFSSNSATGLNSRQSCCTQSYQPQSCYFPTTHSVPQRMAHNQSASVTPPSANYLSAQQPLGQSPHLNALSASCKYGGVITDYSSGNKLKNSNDLYLNTHHYDSNPPLHNYGYGSGHSNQQLYASNAHQPVAHGPMPTSILAHDSLNSTNPASYTNDLSLTASNFNNYHTHLDTHLSSQTLVGVHSQQPPSPAYGPVVAKRALLDYRKPIQPQPPPTISDECYPTLASRDHYNDQELLNTPETTTSFAEYETQQDNNANISPYTHSEILNNVAKSAEENNKNLSLRDFIANWNDDEDEYQNNDDLNFDQSQLINEVLQTAPIQHQVATVEEPSDVEPKEVQKCVETINAQTLSETDVSQYVNLPDIVIDIEKSNNVNNSITTPSTSPTPTSLNLNNFDVEKELDELKLKKPMQEELTKDIIDIKNTTNITTPQLSPCKNLNIQLSFEDLNLESNNKTVLNDVTATRLTNNQSLELSDHYLKDIGGYDSGSSRHSNESAFEKEYETFIHKITGDTDVKNINSEKASEKNNEIDFEQNFQDFSKFYKRKRKLKEDELRTSLSENQNQKKVKTNAITKDNNSNFPQVYTKKSRNRFNKIKQQRSQKRKPLSVFYKIVHSMRHFGLYRLKRVREYMIELKEKHLPLIKRQSIKNNTRKIANNLFNAYSLKTLCIMTINTDEFRQRLMLPLTETTCEESEEKHICTDPTCETCEVIKSLMESENFEESVIKQVPENNSHIAALLCEDGNTEPIIILDNVENIADLNLAKQESTMISNDDTNFKYSNENPSEFEAKDLEQSNTTTLVLKSLFIEDANLKIDTEIADSRHHTVINKFETEFDSQNWFERTNLLLQDSKAKIPLQPVPKTVGNYNLENRTTDISLHTEESEDKLEAIEYKLGHQTELFDKENLELSAEKVVEITGTSSDLKNISTKTENVKTNESLPILPINSQESEDSESSDSDSDSSSSSSTNESINDSQVKSDKNDSSCSSSSESESEYEDEKLHSCSKLLKKGNNKPFDFTESETMIQRPANGVKAENGVKESKIRKQNNMNYNTDSDSETECVPERHERIVIRIKKPFNFSLDQSNFNDEHYSESYTESESESEDISLKESKTVSKKQSDFAEDSTSEKSVNRHNRFDNPIESESDSDDVADKKSEVISTILRLSPQQMYSKDSEKSVIQHTNGADCTESEPENDKKKSAIPSIILRKNSKSVTPYNDLKISDENESDFECESGTLSMKLRPQEDNLIRELAENYDINQPKDGFISRQINSEELTENQIKSKDYTEVPKNEEEIESEKETTYENEPSTKLSSKQHVSPKSSELNESDVMVDNLEIIYDHSSVLKNSKLEVISEKSAEIYENTDSTKHVSKFIKTYSTSVNATGNDFENDEAVSPSRNCDTPSRESSSKNSEQIYSEIESKHDKDNKNIHLDYNDDKSKISDSENDYNSEYETEKEDAAVESIKISDNLIPIIKSDGDSIDASETYNETKKSDDALRLIESVIKCNDSENVEQFLVKPNNNEVFEDSQVKTCSEDSNFLRNTTKLNNLNDAKLASIDENVCISLNQHITGNVLFSSTSVEELKYETNPIEISQNQISDDENLCEKNNSEFTSFSEYSDEDIESKLCTNHQKKFKNKHKDILESILPETIISKTSCKNFEYCNDNSNSSEISNSQKTDENVFKTTDYVSKIIDDYSSEQSMSSVSSQPDIQLLPTIQKQIMFKENSRSSEIFFEHDDQKQDQEKNSNTFENVVSKMETSNEATNVKSKNIVLSINLSSPKEIKDLDCEDFYRNAATEIVPQNDEHINKTKYIYSDEMKNRNNNLLQKSHIENPTTTEEIYCEQQSVNNEFVKHFEYVKEKHISEHEVCEEATTVNNSEIISGKSECSEAKINEDDMLISTDNKSTKTCKNVFFKNETDNFLNTEDQIEEIEKEPLPQISEKINKEMLNTARIATNESESGFNQIIDENCGQPTDVLTETTTNEEKTSDENHVPENVKNVSDLSKSIEKDKIIENENMSKLTSHEFIVCEEAGKQSFESLEKVANEKETDQLANTVEKISEEMKLLEERNTQNAVELEDVPHNILEDTILKVTETIKESKATSLIAEPETVFTNDVLDILNKEDIVAINPNKTVLITSTSISLNKEKVDTTTDTIIELKECLKKESAQDSENVQKKTDHIDSLNKSTSSENFLKKPINDKLETSKSFEYQNRSEPEPIIERSVKTSEQTGNENPTMYELEELTEKPDSLGEEKISFNQETKSEDDTLVSKTSQIIEIQSEDVKCDLEQSLSENLLNKEITIQEVSNDNSEGYVKETCSDLQTHIEDDVLEFVETQTSTETIDKSPAEKLERNFNEILSETIVSKNSVSQEDLSGDFYGFKNQSSFEDESEDFHGFEDLAEVTRIRQEIESFNDDSAANDGFLNSGPLNRDLIKSSTTSLAGSTSSEINELEALEKELSQHQPEMQMEDDDKDTDKHLKIKNNNIVVSTNDIEQIKKMLESDEEQPHDVEDKVEVEQEDKCKDKLVENNKNMFNDNISSVSSIIPKLSDLCRAALNSSLNSNSNLKQHTETCTILVERELSVEEALAEMYRQAGVLLSDPEDCDNDAAPSGVEEAHDVLLLNLHEILNGSDNNDVYVLQCNMNDNVLNVEGEEQNDNTATDSSNAERVNTVQFIGIIDTENSEPQIHIISSDSESEVILLSDDETDFSLRPSTDHQERITIPFINDDILNYNDTLSDISTIHHEEIVPDNLNKFLQEEFYKYLYEKYVQRNISKYYHANRVLKKYKKRYVKAKRQ